MLLSGVDRICTSSVWEETPFWWKKKDRKWIDNHSFKTSTFSYWTRMCHVSHSLKYTFTMLLSGWTKCAGLLSNRRGAYFVTPGPRRLSVEIKWPYIESVYEYEYTNGFLFCCSKSKVYWTYVLYRAIWSFYLTKISCFKLFFLVMLVCYIYTWNHCLPRLANCLTVNTSFYKEKFSFKASMFQLV